MVGRYWHVQNGVVPTNQRLVCKWRYSEMQAVGKNVLFICQIYFKTFIKDKNKNSTGVSLENFEIISSEESRIAWISPCTNISTNWSEEEFKQTVTVLISYNYEKFIEYCLKIDRLFDAKPDQYCREEWIFHDCWDHTGRKCFRSLYTVRGKITMFSCRRWSQFDANKIFYKISKIR